MRTLLGGGLLHRASDTWLSKLCCVCETICLLPNICLIVDFTWISVFRLIGPEIDWLSERLNIFIIETIENNCKLYLSDENFDLRDKFSCTALEILFLKTLTLKNYI